MKKDAKMFAFLKTGILFFYSLKKQPMYFYSNSQQCYSALSTDLSNWYPKEDIMP